MNKFLCIATSSVSPIIFFIADKNNIAEYMFEDFYSVHIISLQNNISESLFLHKIHGGIILFADCDDAEIFLKKVSRLFNLTIEVISVLETKMKYIYI